MNEPEITTKDIESALRARYDGRSWACVFNVGNGTGMNCNRRADALAMSLWPSKGLHLHGHEIKVSRSDWLKEIQDVSKAEAFAKYCHYWWIVALKGIVKLEELPPAWGLMNVGPNGSIRVAKPAAIRETAFVDYDIMASMMRASVEQSGVTDSLRAEYQRGYSEGRRVESSKQEVARNDKLEMREFTNLKKSVAQFQEKSGIEIGDYNGRRLGEAVEAVMKCQHANLEGSAASLRREVESLKYVADAMDEAAKAIKCLATQ